MGASDGLRGTEENVDRGGYAQPLLRVLLIQH